jgi:hypothetical protein
MFVLCLFFFEGDDRIMPIVDMLTQLTQLYVRRGPSTGRLQLPARGYPRLIGVHQLSYHATM